VSRLQSVVAVAVLTAGLAVAQPAASPDPDVVRRTQWFRDAKFGMLITWGLYSIPAGEWKGKEYAGIGEWIQNWAHIPVAEYADLAARFNPLKFNAGEWVSLASKAGMKYVVPMPKHHDGFALFASKASKFNVVDATPFQRDPMKELAEACRTQGLRMGFYYSQAQDWHHPGGGVSRGSWDPAQKGDFDQYLNSIALPQVRELLTGYGPIALIWFDTPMQMTPERAQKFVSLVRELQPDCLINGRLGGDRKGVDYSSRGDNEVPEHGVAGAWETPATINDTWAYKKNDNNWKPAEVIVSKLADIVSKGGNYLLNVGPTAEGVIPDASVKILEEVGAWMKVNGEAIYGTGPTPFGGELKGTSFRDDHYVYRKPSGWRCTTKPGKLYIHLFDWANGEFRLEGVKAKVKLAHLLADPKRKLKIRQSGETLIVALPGSAPDRLASVMVLDYTGPWR